MATGRLRQAAAAALFNVRATHRTRLLALPRQIDAGFRASLLAALTWASAQLSISVDVQLSPTRRPFLCSASAPMGPPPLGHILQPPRTSLYQRKHRRWSRKQAPRAGSWMRWRLDRQL